jgi:hypothetical protein
MIFPRWIAPLFNRFTPLEEGDLRRRIEALIERCGFHAEGLFVMDGSSARATATPTSPASGSTSASSSSTRCSSASPRGDRGGARA